MKAIGKFLRENGLYTMIANNSIHTNPPLCITEEQLGRGLRDHRPGARHRRPGGEELAGWRPRSPPAAPPIGAVLGGPAPAGRVVRAAPGGDRRSSGRASSSSAARPGARPGRSPGTPVIWNPPFRWPFANDLKLPHVWNILLAYGQPCAARRSTDTSVAQIPVRSRRSTRGARRRSGSSLGAAARARPCNRLRPLAAARAGVRPVRHREPDDPDHRPRPADRLRRSARTSSSVVIIATYLTFFPVTIAMIRGLRSFDPRAMELMRSYAASRVPDLLEAAVPGVVAVPVHRAEDLGDGQHRGGDHRRRTGRHHRRPRPDDHDVQPVLHHRPREALGGDHRDGHPRDRLLPPDRRGRSRRPAQPPGTARTTPEPGARTAP